MKKQKICPDCGKNHKEGYAKQRCWICHYKANPKFCDRCGKQSKIGESLCDKCKREDRYKVCDGCGRIHKESTILCSTCQREDRSKVCGRCGRIHKEPKVLCNTCQRETRSKVCGRCGEQHQDGTALCLVCYGKERVVVISKDLKKYEEYSEDEQGGILFKCKNSNCSKFFYPTYSQVNERLRAINGTKRGEQNLYCSEECKSSCILYNLKSDPYEKKEPNGYYSSTRKEWADYVKLRDNYTCQACNNVTRIMHAHHIDPEKCNPIESADYDNGVCLCVVCHQFMHTELSGCRYNDLRKFKIEDVRITRSRI